MEQLSLLYTNFWCITLASLTFYIIHEDFEHQKLIDEESKREYYQLDFKNCEKFEIIKNGKEFIVNDAKGFKKYKFIKTKSSILSQDWKFLGNNNELIAKLHINSKWSIFKKDILFPVKILRHHNIEEGLSASSDLSINSNFLNFSSPYIEPILTNNFLVKKNQLNGLIEYNPFPSLHLFEDRKLSRIHVKYFNRYKIEFKVQKNSKFEYNWLSNGYLEKKINIKNEIANKRIGYMKMDDGVIKMFINTEIIENEVAITTCFLKYIIN